MNWSIVKSGSLGAASLLAAALLAGPASADGLPGRGRIASPVPTAACTVAANVGLTTDYVFRGFSQTAEDPALQGGVDFTCGRFYLGVWGSNVDFGAVSPVDTVANVEVDIYGGFKTTTGPVSWDLGFIYYSYPGQNSALNVDFFEVKVGASGDIWKGGTLGGTVFYSPDGQFEIGPTWTVEASLAQALPKVGMFSPTVSALVGYSSSDDIDFDYSYWNVGVTLGFLEKWSVDVRYWDTDLDGCVGGVFSCDSRVVGTVKYTF
jgi:uncharacterized protein (TIGR02001 family)